MVKPSANKTKIYRGLKPSAGRALFSWWAVVFFVAVVAAFGVAYILVSRASSGTEVCGARVSNYNYKVPFGNAPWNVPVCGLPKYAQSKEYASRLFMYSNSNGLTAQDIARRGKVSIGFGLGDIKTSFSRTVYSSKDANRTIQVQNTVYLSNLDGSEYKDLSYTPRASIPWNDSWVVAEGGDNEAVILDDLTGKMYEVSGLKKDLAAITQCGIFFRDRLCAYSVNVVRDSSGNIIDYRTYQGSSPPSRGAGIPMYATLTTPEEVLAGEIRHALNLVINNTSFGPECSKAQLGTSAEGNSCGTALAPASKFEWGAALKASDRSTPNSTLQLNMTVPEGMRFALEATDAEIESWINSRPSLKSNARKAQTARIFARALREYGAIVVDTGGSANIQVAGAHNPKSKNLWNQMGINTEADSNILDGLITANNMYVVAPPTNNCIDGTKSSYFCKYLSSQYTSSSGQVLVPPASSADPVVVTPASPAATSPAPAEPPSTTVAAKNIIPSAPSSPSASLNISFLERRYNLSLRWGSSAANGGIKEYIIARNGIEIGRTKSLFFTDNTIEANKPYLYAVQALSTSGNKSFPSLYPALVKCSWIFCSL